MKQFFYLNHISSVVYNTQMLPKCNISCIYSYLTCNEFIAYSSDMDYLAAVFHITVTYFVLDKNMSTTNK